MELSNRIWSGGQLFAFSALDGTSPYADGLVARVALNNCGVEVVYPERLMISFPTQTPTECVLGGDFFTLQTAGQTVRGAFADAWNLLVEGHCFCQSNSPQLLVTTEGQRTLISVSGHFRQELLRADFSALYQARTAWLRELPAPAGLAPEWQPLFWKAASVMKTQLYTPEGRVKHRWSTPDRFPHRHMWLWDSVFHAIGWRHLNPALARELISAVFDCQQENGFIPHMMWPAGQSDITQPPVLAYGAALVNAVAPDKEWIAELYAPLAAYLAWNRANRDSDGCGLLEWFIEGDPCCRSGESGMDNSSRFDAATRMDAVDFNCFMAKEYDCLAEFAAVLGKTADVAKWKGEADGFRRRINDRLWDSRRGFYYDYDVENSSFCPVAAVSGFLPLFCGAAGKEQVQALLKRLDDPQDFGTPLPLPSVSRSDPSFGHDMWRGPGWLNMAWLIAEGLRDYGYPERAEALRRVWLAQINKHYLASGCIFEYYDALDERSPLELPRKNKTGDFPHQVIRDYGWSATLSLDWCCRSLA